MKFRHPQYPNGNLYLSGGMQFAAAKGEGWRTSTSPSFKKLGFFPVDIVALDRAYAADHGELYGPENTDTFLQMKSNIREHFIHTDLRLIEDHCDAVVILYDESVRRGCGTQAECQHAYNHNLPVFLVSTFENWEKEVPLWLQALTTKIFTSFDDLFAYLASLPPGIIIKDRYGNHHDGKGNYLCFLSGEVFKKRKSHFVSTVTPLYSRESVKLIVDTREKQSDRYQYFVDNLATLGE